MIGHFDRLMRKGRSGQATAEYIIIVALVAVAAIVVITAFGGQIKNLFTHSTSKLAGQTDDEYTDEADTNATDAQNNRGQADLGTNF